MIPYLFTLSVEMLTSPRPTNHTRPSYKLGQRDFYPNLWWGNGSTPQHEAPPSPGSKPAAQKKLILKRNQRKKETDSTKKSKKETGGNIFCKLTGHVLLWFSKFLSGIVGIVTGGAGGGGVFGSVVLLRIAASKTEHPLRTRHRA